MRVQCLIQEHNMMFPARAGTQTAHSGVKGTNHGATPPSVLLVVVENCDKINLLVSNSVYYVINILILILG